MRVCGMFLHLDQQQTYNSIQTNIDQQTNEYSTCTAPDIENENYFWINI